MKKPITQWTSYIIIALCVALNLAIRHNERVAREKRLQAIGEHGAQILSNMNASDFYREKTPPTR